ncbi:MAG: sugar ABC transporter permease [Anaerolineae bacterium]
MAATSTPLKVEPRAKIPGRLPPVLYLVILWQVLVAAGLVFLALQLFQQRQFFNLGPFVPVFVGVVALIAATALALSGLFIARHSSMARLVGVVGNFAGFGLSLIYLGQIIGLYQGVDQLAYSVFDHAALLLGFPIGYAIAWIGRRFFHEETPGRRWLTRSGWGLIILTSVILLLFSGWPGLLIQNPAAALSQVITPASIGTAIAAALFLAAGSALIRHGELFGETILQREAWQGWLFLLPNFLSFILFFAMPLVLSLYLSFTNYNAIQEAQFIGIENYSRLLSLDIQMVPEGTPPASVLKQDHFPLFSIPLGSQSLVVAARDPVFWQSLWTTARYVVILLLLGVVPAFALAMLLNSKIPGMKFFRAAYFLPSIAAVVGVALVWQWLYDPVIGYINYAIAQLVNFLNTLGIPATNPNIQWLSDDNLMVVSAAIMAAWQVVGFNTVIILAGLQGVPKELIEASTVDGAGPWLRFRRIILPMLAPTTFFVMITTLIAGLQAFSEMYTLFGNSTSNARLTVVYYLYQQGFQRFQMGYASATAWVLFVVIFIITLIQFRMSSRSKAYSD